MLGSHLIITGGSGYIGSEFIKSALSQSFYVTSLGRSNFHIEHPRIQYLNWNLGDKDLNRSINLGSKSFPRPTALVHMAHVWGEEYALSKNLNIKGTRLLIEQLKKIGIHRFIFASSISAREHALNDYGKIKFAIEKIVSDSGGLVARIGLVYGGPESSQWGTLIKLVRKTSVLPMVCSDNPVYPISCEEVSKGLLRLIELEHPKKSIYFLAASNSIPFKKFLKSIAMLKFSKKLIIIPVPAIVILAIANLFDKTSLRRYLDKEKVLGLMGLVEIDSGEDLLEINLLLEDFESKLSNYKKKRNLLILEGFILMRAILGENPSTKSLRLYQMGVKEQLKNAPLEGLRISGFLKWLQLLDISFTPRNVKNLHSDLLGDRIKLALMILEYQKSSKFVYRYEDMNALLSIFILLGTVIYELMIATPIRFILRCWR